MSSETGIDPLNSIVRVNTEHVYIILNDGIWRFLPDGSTPIKAHSSSNSQLIVDREINNLEVRYAYKGDGSPAILKNQTFDYNLPVNELTNPDISLYTSRVDGTEVKIVRDGVDLELDISIGPFTDETVIGSVFFDGEFLCITYLVVDRVSSLIVESATVQYSKPKLNKLNNIWSSKRGNKIVLISHAFGISASSIGISFPSSAGAKTLGFNLLVVADSGGIIESDNSLCSRTKTGSRYLFYFSPNLSVPAISIWANSDLVPVLFSFSDIGGDELSRFVIPSQRRRLSIGTFTGIPPIPIIAATQELVFRLDYPNAFFFSIYDDPVQAPGGPYPIANMKDGDLIIYKLDGLVQIKSISITDFFANDILSMAATMENLFIWAGGNVNAPSGNTETKCYIYDLSISRDSSGIITDIAVSAIMHTVNMPSSYIPLIPDPSSIVNHSLTSKLTSIVSRG